MRIIIYYGFEASIDHSCFVVEAAFDGESFKSCVNRKN